MVTRVRPPSTLAERTTLRVGGPARAWIVAETEQELIDAVTRCDDDGSSVLILGGGSNLLVADQGFPGTVVEVATRGVGVADDQHGARLSVEAGEPWDELVEYSVAQGWSGIEALSGIPGRAGATPIQNVGAYGQDVAQVTTSVRALDRRTGQVVVLDRGDCQFGYRTSAFKRDRERWVVLSVDLRVATGPHGVATYAELAQTLGVPIGGLADVREIRAAVLTLRRRKGMVLDAADPDTWSAGSFFTNPVLDEASAAGIPQACPRYPAASGVKLSAAWLIEQSGIGRGHALSPTAPAAISTKHTLALTNRGGATAADILALASAVQAQVRETFGVDLAIEPTLVGFAAS
jgi:UDP-N-acetylmuramate dehydrogenase